MGGYGSGFLSRLGCFFYLVMGKWKRPILGGKYYIRSTVDSRLFWNDGWREWVEDGITVFTEQHRREYPLPANGQWADCSKLTEMTEIGEENKSEQVRKVACL